MQVPQCSSFTNKPDLAIESSSKDPSDDFWVFFLFRENMDLNLIVYQTSFLNLVKPHDICTTNAFIHARFLKLSVDPLSGPSEGV